MKSLKVLLLAAIFLCSMFLIAGACEKNAKTSTAQAQCDHQDCCKKANLTSSDKEHCCAALKASSASSHCEGKESNLTMKAGACEKKLDGSQTSATNLTATAEKCCAKASLTSAEEITPAEEPTPQKSDGTVNQKAVLNVSGMTCGGCASEVKSALMKVDGVKECKVSWKDGKAEVGFCCDPSKAQSLVKAVNKIGFKASLASVQTMAQIEDEDAEDADDSDDGEDIDVAPKQMVVKDKETFKATSYVCENCGYQQAKAGSCPMDKTKLSKVTERHTFVCEECDYAQAKPGSCPGHKTALVEYSVKYECPACKMVYAEPGMCSMCKKQLQMMTDKPVATGKQMISKEKSTY